MKENTLREVILSNSTLQDYVRNVLNLHRVDNVWTFFSKSIFQTINHILNCSNGWKATSLKKAHRSVIIFSNFSVSIGQDLVPVFFGLCHFRYIVFSSSTNNYVQLCPQRFLQSIWIYLKHEQRGSDQSSSCVPVVVVVVVFISSSHHQNKDTYCVCPKRYLCVWCSECFDVWMSVFHDEWVVQLAFRVIRWESDMIDTLEHTDSRPRTTSR